MEHSDSKGRCFVAMPFSDTRGLTLVWSDVIRQRVFGESHLAETFRCLRADEILGSNPVMEDVKQSILDADLILADLTTANPNVYYEVGIAHQLAKPCLLLLQNDERPPFDISHLRHIRYSVDPTGLEKLARDIVAAIDDIVNEDLDRDYGLLELRRLEEARVQVDRLRESLQRQYVRVPRVIRQRYGDVTGGGYVRLHPGRQFYHTGEPLHGSYYAFLTGKHQYGYGSDISYRDGYLKVGFAGWDYGFFLDIGAVGHEAFLQIDGSCPDWLPQALQQPWQWLSDHTPPTDEPNAREVARSNPQFGSITLRDQVDPIVGNTYLLRSVSYRDWDILVAFRVEMVLPDRSLVLIWRLIKRYPTPENRVESSMSVSQVSSG